MATYRVKVNHSADLVGDRLRLYYRLVIAGAYDYLTKFVGPRIRRKIPVDTGRLRRSFSIRRYGDEIHIGFRAPYAPYVRGARDAIRLTQIDVDAMARYIARYARARLPR